MIWHDSDLTRCVLAKTNRDVVEPNDLVIIVGEGHPNMMRPCESTKQDNCSVNADHDRMFVLRVAPRPATIVANHLVELSDDVFHSSPQQGLNPRPSAYKTAALPLSYEGDGPFGPNDQKGAPSFFFLPPPSSSISFPSSPPWASCLS